MPGEGGSSTRFPSASDELVIQMVSEATGDVVDGGETGDRGAVAGRQSFGNPCEVGVEVWPGLGRGEEGVPEPRGGWRCRPVAASARFNRETSRTGDEHGDERGQAGEMSARRCNDHSLWFPLGSAESRRRGRLSRRRSRAIRARRDAPTGRPGARRVRRPRPVAPLQPPARSTEARVRRLPERDPVNS